MKILLLEDDSLSRSITENALTDHAGEIFVGKDGKEGLDLFSRHNPHIVITDLNMPVMNGLDFIKKVRVMNPTIPIIVISGVSDSETLIESIDLKVDKYILKPFSPEEIREVVKTFSRKVLTKQFGRDGMDVEMLHEELKEVLKEIIMKFFASFLKEKTGRGASKVNVILRRNCIEVKLYDTFTLYEKTLANHVYDIAFVESIRKKLYESYISEIEKRISYSTDLSVVVKDIRVSLKDDVEKFTLEVMK